MIQLFRWPQFLVWPIVLFFAACSGPRPVAQEPDQLPSSMGSHEDRTLDVTLLHFNDVYEITPVEGGKRGGLARLATLRRGLLDENPNTLTLLPGDFVSPSAMGTAKVDGERLAGRQMVDVLNKVGVDYVTFGNHEFDVSHEQLKARIDESEFTYVSGNVRDDDGVPFPGVEPYRIVEIPASSGDTLRLGLLGVTLSLTGADYVSYDDPLEVVRQQAALLRDSVHVLVAMTHLFLEQDIELVEQVPELDLVLGGHDHENIQVWRGPDLTPIAKADANARTVYVDNLHYDFETGQLDIEVNLKLITDDIPEHPETAAAVDYWVEQAWAGFRESGFAPSESVATLKESYDGREGVVRNGSTRLTRLILHAMRQAAGDVDVVFFNSGSIRIDDVLPPGPVTQYDVIRVLPFGGEIVTIEISGALLDSVLTQSVMNQGTGGYLQVGGVSNKGGAWFIGPDPIETDRQYRVALNDFLLLGIESGFETLTLENPGLTKLAEHGDIRLAVIAELKRLGM